MSAFTPIADIDRDGRDVRYGPIADIPTAQTCQVRRDSFTHIAAGMNPTGMGQMAIDIGRRQFISAFGGATVAWPFVVRAQQAERMRRIGVLVPFTASDPDEKAWLKAFQDGLQSLGWVQGRNISVDYRWAGGDPDRLRTYAAELVGMAPDVIFSVASPPLVTLHEVTHSLPIVFVQVSDPVKLGFVASLAHPGGNITGFVNFEHAIGSKWLELLNDTVPGTVRAAVIFDPDNVSQASYLQAIEDASPSFGVQLTRTGVRNAAEIESAIGAFAQEGKGAVIVLPNNVSLSYRDLVIALAAQHRLPAVYPYRVFTSNGGFLSYGVDLADQYRRAASYVDLVLKGAKPGEMPVQLPTKYELVINLKTAKDLSLVIPAQFLQLADEVIE
jgi:putative tryptophan/tyrosine transport system substrate-binding protein